MFRETYREFIYLAVFFKIYKIRGSIKILDRSASSISVETDSRVVKYDGRCVQ